MIGRATKKILIGVFIGLLAAFIVVALAEIVGGVL